MNKLSLKIILPTALVLLFANALANDGGNATFFSILQQGLDNSDKIKAAKANLLAAKEKIIQNRAELLPELSLEYNSNIDRELWRGGSDSSNPENISLSLSVPIIDLKSWRDYQQAFPHVAAVELDLKEAIQQNVFNVVKEIVEVIKARKVALLSKNNVEVTKRHMEATSYRHSVGELTITEQSRAISRHATAYADWIDAKNQAHIAFARLEEVVGSEVDDNQIVVANLEYDLFDQPLESNLPMLENRFDILAAKSRVDEAKKNLNSSKAGHFPTVSLNSEAERTWDRDSGIYPGVSDSLAVEFEIKLPLYSGGATSSKQNQAKFSHQAKQANLDELRKKAKRELQEATYELESAKAKKSALTTAVASAKETLDGIQQEFQVGTRTSLDLLDTQQELFTAQTSLIKSHYSLILAKYKILKAVNRLSFTELKGGQPNPKANIANNKEIDKPQKIKTSLSKNGDSDVINGILLATISKENAVAQTADMDSTLPQKKAAITASQNGEVATNSPDWTVQISATQQQKSANKILARIKDCSCSPYISYYKDVNGQEWYKIRFGQYKTADLAKTDALAFSKKAGIKAWVTKK
ncbi:MAG: TolC family outer membrane protein [Magnetococcales bacterium]|nr:TolC family outer membrane protein [Magnetococcales bacterium]